MHLPSPARICAYDYCRNPYGSKRYYTVKAESCAGGQNWRVLAGKTLCYACYTKYRADGELQRVYRKYAKPKYRIRGKVAKVVHGQGGILPENTKPEYPVGGKVAKIVHGQGGILSENTKPKYFVGGKVPKIIHGQGGIWSEVVVSTRV